MRLPAVYPRQTNNRKNFRTFDANRVCIEIRRKWNAHPSCAARTTHARATTTRVVEQNTMYIWSTVPNWNHFEELCIMDRAASFRARIWWIRGIDTHTWQNNFHGKKKKTLIFRHSKSNGADEVERLGKGKASWCRATCRQLGSVTTPPSRRVTATNHAIRNCRYQLHDFM